MHLEMESEEHWMGLGRLLGRTGESVTAMIAMIANRTMTGRVEALRSLGARATAEGIMKAPKAQRKKVG